MHFKVPLMLVMASALALAGCDTMNGPNDNTKAKGGAITGALIGAGIGGIFGKGDRTAQAVAGAAVGAALGGAIGHELDKQAAELRQQIGDNNVTVRNTGSALVVTMPQDILFATNSDSVRPDLRRDLRAIAQNLQEHPDSTIEVIGNTDNTGPAAYNMRLSQRRAAAVSDVLIASGLSPQRISTVGRGENNPVATNLTAEGRAKNRRVDIVIHPTQAQG